MNKKYNPNLGDEIKDIVQDVLNTNNFNRLNRDIGRTVNSALRDVESMIFGGPKYEDPDALWEPLKTSKTAGANFGGGNYQGGGSEGGGQKKRPEKWQGGSGGDGSVICQAPPGRISGILLTVFGLLGVGIFGSALAAYGVAAAFFNLNIVVNSLSIGAMLPLLVISGIVAGKGIQLRKRVVRFRRYVVAFNGRSYCNIKELAIAIGKSEKFVSGDLQKMIHLGMFPQGHLDDEKTCFMLEDATYKHYLELQRQTAEQREMEESERQNQAKQQETRKNEDEAQRQLRVTIEEGKEYIKQIRKANDDIPGEEVSNKLDRLEAITSRIFRHIEAHPEQIPEIRKFMNYYLPTTLKLTNAYKELDNQPAMGENISSAKDEIQKTLDTINTAFENLLDNLFYHAAMDISSDISVLETMLAQEGLTEKDFTKKSRAEE